MLWWWWRSSSSRTTSHPRQTSCSAAPESREVLRPQGLRHRAHVSSRITQRVVRYARQVRRGRPLQDDLQVVVAHEPTSWMCETCCARVDAHRAAKVFTGGMRTQSFGIQDKKYSTSHGYVSALAYVHRRQSREKNFAVLN